jgi:hypothetical protein
MTFEEDALPADEGVDAGAAIDVPSITIGASQCRQRIRILRPATFSSGTTYLTSQLAQLTFMSFARACGHRFARNTNTGRPPVYHDVGRPPTGQGCPRR